MLNSLNRRQWFRGGGLLATAPALFSWPQRASAAVPATAGKLRLDPDIYQSIGVHPVINCRGTLTVISGSLELPEVRAAVDNGGLRRRHRPYHGRLRNRRQSRPARADSRSHRLRQG